MNQRFSEKPTADLAVEAMQAGLNGEKCPNFGRLSPDQLRIVNAIYDAARNRSAGDRVIAHRAKP